jgi:hypothetical protein
MKKGQAAMEFLMTYGWAILVVIAAIAALAYFGVLDPARILPERCQFPAGMDCIDKASITETYITLALRNNQGFPVNITDLETDLCTHTAQVEEAQAGASTSWTDLSTDDETVANNEVVRVRVNCDSINAGEKADGQMTVSYLNTESGLANQAVGDVRGRVAS